MPNRTPKKRPQRTDTAQAEFLLPTRDLEKDLSFFGETLGFRLETIFPADDPAVAVMSGYGVRLRLERGAAEAPGTLRLACSNPAAFAGGRTELTAPNGTRIEIVDADPPLDVPRTRHEFVVHRLADSGPPVAGRAGMQYRDLIPGRLGGCIVASHIRIPKGGPVPDSVHYHTVRFQMIFCYRGWVRLVYEDQGAPFVLNAGDCVLQPPEIRHRVLEASDNLEVVEIAVPAEHVTTIGHDMTLPTETRNPERDFGGQKFCLHRAARARWRRSRIAGFEARDTGIAKATGGVADVQVVRLLDEAANQITGHTADILFTFLLAGSMTLHAQDGAPRKLSTGDTFVIPPGARTAYTDCSRDLEFLEVALPGSFETIVHGKS